MKLFHYILPIIAAAIAGAGFSACSDDDGPVSADTATIIASSGNDFSGKGGILEILVNSNVAYSVNVDADWISRIVPRSAPVNGVERFTVMPYPVAADMTPRTATVTITYPGIETQRFEVRQTPAEIFRFKISAGVTRIPSKGGELVIQVDANIDYSAEVSDPTWITPADAATGAAVFNIAENTAAEPRSGKITFHAGDLGEHYVEFTQDPFVKDKGIATAAQLMDFANAVNTGASLEQWTDDNEEVILLADIDMSGIAWTPIGNLHGSAFSNSATTLGTDGYAFTGVFNGNGHSISNLAMSTDSEQCYGLFGVCTSATVKNLVIDSSCTLQVTNEAMTASSAYGFVAGLLYQSTVENVTVGGTVLESLINKGSSKNMGVLAAIAGYAYSSAVTDCRFSGTIKRVRSNVYDNSLGSGTAGIVGFARGTSDQPVTITGCVNSGNIYAATNRVAGILGSTPGNYILRDCENAGTVHACSDEALNAGWSSGLRVGGILGFSSNTKAANVGLLERCVNSGTVVSDADAKTQTGGIVGLVRNLTLTDVSNTGCVIATSGSIAGLICGQLQCADKPVINSCRVGGRFATAYTGSDGSIQPQDPVTVDAGNYFQYAAGNVTGTNSGIWTTDKVTFQP